MPEEVFVKEVEKLNVLFNHPSVEGVYEKQVPLNVRAVLELGSLCTFDESQRGVLGKGLEHGFDLSALRRAPAKQPYMSEPTMDTSSSIMLWLGSGKSSHYSRRQRIKLI
jgi:DNA polymerase epsilon subunit 1